MNCNSDLDKRERTFYKREKLKKLLYCRGHARCRNHNWLNTVSCPDAFQGNLVTVLRYLWSYLLSLKKINPLQGLYHFCFVLLNINLILPQVAFMYCRKMHGPDSSVTLEWLWIYTFVTDWEQNLVLHILFVMWNMYVYRASSWSLTGVICWQCKLSQNQATLCHLHKLYIYAG